MPHFDYECLKCGNIQEEFHSCNSTPVISCISCGEECCKVFLTAPATVIPPHMQAHSDKMKYYGVKDIVTGEGITETTNIQDKPGIRVKSQPKNMT